MLAYLKDDVRSTLGRPFTPSSMATWVGTPARRWWWSVKLPDGRLPTVAECLTWPRPDTSWMSDPIDPDARRLDAMIDKRPTIFVTLRKW